MTDLTLSQGRAQQLINLMLQATPERPVKLPIQPIESEVILTPETKRDLYTIAGILAGGAILSVILYNLTK